MKILVLDDHPVYSDGLAMILNQMTEEPDVVQLKHPKQAFEYLESNPADLILLDLCLPTMSGFTFMKELQKKNLKAPILVVSASEDPQDIDRAMDSGALGFVHKSIGRAEMMLAIRVVLTGNNYISRKNTSDTTYFGEEELNNEYDEVMSQITDKQLAVLSLLAKGYSNKQISYYLHRSECTVKSHLRMLFRTLKVSNRTECVLAAKKLRLLSETSDLH